MSRHSDLLLSCPLCLESDIELFSTCPLSRDGQVVLARYFVCRNCDLRFLDPDLRLSDAQEKARYMTHNNGPNSSGHREFLQPFAEKIVSRVRPGATGLDFGSGPYPMLSLMLSEESLQMQNYDPYFANDKSLLNQVYDFVCASEVVEHLHSPAGGFAQLTALLRPSGLLAIMTQLYHDQLDFKSWYYRRDPTHVVFYSQKTFSWIKEFFHFEELDFHGPRIILMQKMKS